ncbi:NADH:ubiquinone oxidoreductase, subunit NDUFB4 [Lecanosticta acicola]|uniref:NADH:ubiquinone oxidoreductase, subunit NDUFB4 n=1 Tax=Lecanosticta acicola TaxID=111012 RepID=A0AAI8Z0L9_9PEZI|nr:NADH:ubiquinone oxidoreductase, subunit NDUFB4 [Lecanosticta acicola]
MYVKRHEYFRWTPRTAWLTFTYVVAVPAAFIYMGWTTDGKYDMRGKLKGDTIAEF